MGRETSTLGLVAEAAVKLGGEGPAWNNLLAYLQSLYAGRVKSFDFAEAMTALARLSEAEQNALIAWVVYVAESSHSSSSRARRA